MIFRNKPLSDNSLRKFIAWQKQKRSEQEFKLLSNNTIKQFIASEKHIYKKEDSVRGNDR